MVSLHGVEREKTSKGFLTAGMKGMGNELSKGEALPKPAGREEPLADSQVLRGSSEALIALLQEGEECVCGKGVQAQTVMFCFF